MRPTASIFMVLATLASSCAAGAATEDSGLVAALPPETTATPATTATTTSLPDVVDSAPEREVTRGEGQPVGSAARLKADGAPVFAGDFADPFVMRVGDTYYAYATNTFTSHVPLMRAVSGGQGRYLGDVLPKLPAWSEWGHVWAPSVSPVGDGFVLWYSTRHSASGRQCISAASADSPEGPFVDSSSEPLVCDLEHGGSIDPSPVVDRDGSLWLLWKSDGNCCGLPTVIYSQPLTPDGLTVAGDASELIRNDLWWERDVVEAPTIAYGPDRYHLLYSANRWDTDDYAVGHAICDSIIGPCEKDPGPWLSSYDDVWGPGGAEFVPQADGGAGFVAYHAWTASGIGYPDGARSLFVAKLEIENGALISPSFAA